MEGEDKTKSVAVDSTAVKQTDDETDIKLNLNLFSKKKKPKDMSDEVPDAGIAALSLADRSGRPVTEKPMTDAQDYAYNMNHGRRGECLVFSFENFHPKSGLSPRNGTENDVQRCSHTFTKLGYEVQVHRDLKKEELLSILRRVSAADHTQCDSLVMVFMSHGDTERGQEVICTYDDRIKTRHIWEAFLGDKCPTLAGKPKMLFIQACRGQKTDRGVGLRVSTDGPSLSKDSYVLPVHADLLVMWGSFEGLFSFRTSRNGISGSVFIHFLTKILDKEAAISTLFDMLLKVSRSVAIEFESQMGGDTPLNHNKQVPHISSTLLRQVIFPPLQ